ncbi:hypothetical protein PG999_011838 [Apiospora kogelbergensis]|uniref:Uncharacterized protein n=1 Tax=Apiospora kogelbergensis TaxID=1337665 RepID=A0AAW0QQJ1_9PEZI
MFTELIEPLCTIRGLEDVKFNGPVDCPALQNISQQMRHAFNSAEELIKMQKYFWQQGRDAELKGQYSDAICHYKVGIDDVYNKDYSWTWHMLLRLRVSLLEGSPEFNSIFHIRLGTYNSLSRCAHKYLLQLNKTSPTHRSLAAKAILSGINWARQAYQFAGMTRSQAREAHLNLAFAFHHKAEWMKSFAAIGRPDAAWVRSQQQYIYSPEDSDTGSDIAYEHAAKHLFYAKEIDPSHDVLEGLDGEDRAMCHKIRPPPPEGFRILEHDIPLMGTWRVDPQVWKWWAREGSCHWMKKLLGQRHSVDSGAAEAETQEEIAAQYASDGITWDFGLRSRPFGSVHFFHMVSDNPDHI